VRKEVNRPVVGSIDMTCDVVLVEELDRFDVKREKR
jgi:hypothetical protein